MTRICGRFNLQIKRTERALQGGQPNTPDRTLREHLVIEPPNKPHFRGYAAIYVLKIIVAGNLKFYMKSQETIYRPLETLQQYATKQIDID